MPGMTYFPSAGSEEEGIKGDDTENNGPREIVSGRLDSNVSPVLMDAAWRDPGAEVSLVCASDDIFEP